MPDHLVARPGQVRRRHTSGNRSDPSSGSHTAVRVAPRKRPAPLRAGRRTSRRSRPGICAARRPRCCCALPPPERSVTTSVRRSGPPRAPSATSVGKRTSLKAGHHAFLCPARDGAGYERRHLRFRAGERRRVGRGHIEVDHLSRARGRGRTGRLGPGQHGGGSRHHLGPPLANDAPVPGADRAARPHKVLRTRTRPRWRLRPATRSRARRKARPERRSSLAFREGRQAARSRRARPADPDARRSTRSRPPRRAASRPASPGPRFHSRVSLAPKRTAEVVACCACETAAARPRPRRSAGPDRLRPSFCSAVASLPRRACAASIRICSATAA